MCKLVQKTLATYLCYINISFRILYKHHAQDSPMSVTAENNIIACSFKGSYKPVYKLKPVYYFDLKNLAIVVFLIINKTLE